MFNLLPTLWCMPKHVWLYVGWPVTHTHKYIYKHDAGGHLSAKIDLSLIWVAHFRISGAGSALLVDCSVIKMSILLFYSHTANEGIFQCVQLVLIGLQCLHVIIMHYGNCAHG